MYFRSNINHHSKKYGDVEYDITLASYGPGTGTQTRIESDCGNFQGAIVQGMI